MDSSQPSSDALYRRLRGMRVTLGEQAPPDETALQVLWADAERRPRHLALPDGTPVEILDAGTWNHADGPDFRNALVAFGGVLRRGDVEIHLTPRDWDLHGHAADPAYANVMLHVVWHPAPPAKTLPDAVPQVILRGFAEAEAAFRPAAPDAGRTPYADAPRPCRVCMEATPGERDRILRSAGHFRLRVKASALTEAIGAQGRSQALYAGIMTAMGYGRNADNFRRLAAEVPFEIIREFSPEERFAALAGVAGLLTPRHRDLWDTWWRLALPPPDAPYVWETRTQRPQNHPFRRLAGAVGILQQTEMLGRLPPEKLPAAIAEASALLSGPLGLRGAPVGRSRAAALVVNLIVPYRLALGTLTPDMLGDLPPEHPSAPMREAWFRLTGDPTLPLPDDGLRLQGLLQIHRDFCSAPHGSCGTCPLAHL